MIGLPLVRGDGVGGGADLRPVRVDLTPRRFQRFRQPDALLEPPDRLWAGASSRVRYVPASEKAAVYAEYGIATHRPYSYEVDHLISLELGGSNSIANLWPEAALPRPGFHEKDSFENYLHARVCSGAMTLAKLSS